jgi:hypothetical protein
MSSKFSIYVCNFLDYKLFFAVLLQPDIRIRLSDYQIIFQQEVSTTAFMCCSTDSLPLSAILCKLAHEQEQRDTSALRKSKNLSLAPGQVFSEYFGFPCHSFHQILHPHNHPGQVQ